MKDNFIKLVQLTKIWNEKFGFFYVVQDSLPNFIRRRVNLINFLQVLILTFAAQVRIISEVQTLLPNI